MRGAAIALLLLALVAGGVWLLREQAPAVLPGPEPAVPAGEDDPTGPAATARIERTHPSRPEPGPAAPAAPVVEPPPRAPGTVRLTVHDRARGHQVAAFRWTLRHDDGTRASAAVAGGACELPLGLDRRAVLRVEAEGYEPSSDTPLLATAADPTPDVRVELVPAVPFAGIELIARDEAQRPLERIQVEAVRLAGEVETPEWTRVASDARGTYRLPDLRPGRYRLRVQPVDGQGEPRWFVPRTVVVEFLGHEHVPVALDFVAGGGIALRVVDASGTCVGYDVAARVFKDSGEGVPARWFASIDGQPVFRRDALPGAAPAQLRDPIPAGVYRVQVQIGAMAPIDRELVVEAGRAAELEIRLP